MRRRRIRPDELCESGRRRGDCEEVLQRRHHDEADDDVEDDPDDEDDDDDPTKAAPSSPWRRPKMRAASLGSEEKLLLLLLLHHRPSPSGDGFKRPVEKRVMEAASSTERFRLGSKDAPLQTSGL